MECVWRMYSICVLPVRMMLAVPVRLMPMRFMRLFGCFSRAV